MLEISTGVVARDGLLTYVQREGDMLLAPVVTSVDTPLVAATHVLELHARRYRHDGITVYVDAAGAGAAVVDAIVEIITHHADDSHDLGCVLVSLQGDAVSSIAGTVFHDRSSELLFRFRELVEARMLRVPSLDELHEQLDAFTEQPGKAVRFASPLDVERTLGRYPALAVATLLAVAGKDRPAVQKQRRCEFTLSSETTVRDLTSPWRSRSCERSFRSAASNAWFNAMRRSTYP